MAEIDPTAEAIHSLTKQLHALSVKLDPFKGSDTENVEDFIKDFNKFVNNTGQTEEEDKKQVLQTHLKDLAKEWWKLQDDNKPTDELLTLLKERFKLTEHAQHARKIKIYGLKQKDDETYLEFVSSVRSKSRLLGLTEADQVAICLSGAKPHIRAHLAMQTPKTFKDLLNLPVARDESLCTTADTPLVNIVQEIRELKDTVQNNKTVHFAVDTPVTDYEDKTDYTKRGRSPSPRTTESRSPLPSRSNRGTSPAPRYDRQDSGERSYAQAVSEPMATYGGPRRCNKCGSESYCYRVPAVCPAYDRFCYNCGRQGHFRALCRVPPVVRPPQNFRRSNRLTWEEWDTKDRLSRDRYFNPNNHTYDNLNNRRIRMSMRNGKGNRPNFMRRRTTTYRSQNFNRNMDTRYRSQNRSNFNRNRSYSC